MLIKSDILLYNSLTHKKEVFLPKDEIVKMYTCGPTVYHFAHIGNLRAAIFSDILVKTLKYFNFKVHNLMNFTDVDDKTIKGSKMFISKNNEPNAKLKEYTSVYAKYYLEDMEKLHMEKPWMIMNATESIEQMEFIIQVLFDKGFAYEAEDGIYYSISKNKKYGQLVKVDNKKQKHNTENRMIDDEYDKDNAQDFVLWKFKKSEDEPGWKIKVNEKTYEGRPGWHIECSAMNYKVFGPELDIHLGGVDLKFPHHENEIAQSECAFEQKYVTYWMHCEHLFVDGKKMSKSLGNFYTLRDLEAKNFSPLAFRELALRTHYRQQLNFTMESIKAGEQNIKKINEFYNYLKNKQPKSDEDVLKHTADKLLDLFEGAMKDDLNTPKALSHVYELINEVHKKEFLSQNDINIAKDFMDRTDKILGLLEKPQEIPLEIVLLARNRKKAREEKNFELADQLRKDIENLGYELKDSKNTKEGYIITKK